MSEQKLYHVAVVGATGAVGEQMIRMLEARNFPVGGLKLLSSARSAGTKLKFRGREYAVEEAGPDRFEGVEIALFSAGGDVSRKLVPHAVAAGAICIDNTSAFRMDPETPLVVPEVNPEQIDRHNGVIANPNCSTGAQAALRPLRHRADHRRIRRYPAREPGWRPSCRGRRRSCLPAGSRSLTCCRSARCR